MPDLAFIRAIAEKPEDDLPRLVYADWLDDHEESEAAIFFRQGTQMTGKQFREHVIAQDDDNDYQESGYVAVVIYDLAMIGYYSHCSCYETWADLCGGGISDWFEDDEFKTPTWKWIGSVDELTAMAERLADPSMPDRQADTADYDYNHLVHLYEQVRQWNANRRKKS